MLAAVTVASAVFAQLTDDGPVGRARCCLMPEATDGETELEEGPFPYLLWLDVRERHKCREEGKLLLI